MALTKPSVKMVPTINSTVRAYNGNGHGSTATKIRRFTNSTTTGTAITYADSATNGATFTVNDDGLYSITYSDQNSGSGTVFGISRNASSLTSNLGDTTFANGKLAVVGAAASLFSSVSWTGRLTAGDVIRAHTDSGPNSTAENSNFCITKVGP